MCKTATPLQLFPYLQSAFYTGKSQVDSDDDNKKRLWITDIWWYDSEFSYGCSMAGLVSNYTLTTNMGRS